MICPDLRGLGWSGQPADDDFAKARFADDVLALLDVLGVERAGLLGTTGAVDVLASSRCGRPRGSSGCSP